ncbi:Cyclin-dependent protein kinase inhibitor SMR2 [Acorus gramineus]|uniref:Cyclin-dependent protein kinase inhibitor SMR2 n=1 Tax=Acorus gramineus TaxID=55184 RepID=A0AAV9A9X4_ACOGR|nr:Cyclin-dependent protein kinase inhibitor SMR2 [Acorus gramineus]
MAWTVRSMVVLSDDVSFFGGAWFVSPDWEIWIVQQKRKKKNKKSFMSQSVLELPELVLRLAPTDGGGGDGEDGCRTPTSVEHKIPEVRSCPKAPRKRRRVAPSCKRRLTELEFFRVEPGEIESLFLNLGESEKKHKVVEVELKD